MSGVGLGGAPRYPPSPRRVANAQLGTHMPADLQCLREPVTQSVIRSTHTMHITDGQGCVENAGYNRPSLLHTAELLLWAPLRQYVGLRAQGIKGVLYPRGEYPRSKEGTTGAGGS